MNIKASCTFNLESITAMNHVEMFRKGNPKKHMIFWAIVYGVLLAVLIVQIHAYGWDVELIRSVILLTATMLLMCFFYFLMPRIRYNALGKMKELVNEYTFRDESMIVTTQGELYSGESEIQYSLLFRAMETTGYFFIWQNKNQVFLVDKATIKEGTGDEIRAKLSAYLGKKYVICKY